MVGSNLLENINNRGGAHYTHMPDVSDTEYVSLGGGRAVAPHQATKLLQARQFKYYDKEQGGTLNSVFSNGSKVDIDFVPQGIERLDLLIVEMDLNMTASTAEIPSAPRLIDYLEIRPNQGGTPLGRAYGANFADAMLQVGEEQLRIWKDAYGIDEYWNEGMTLTTATKKIRFPLFGQWFGQSDIFFKKLFKKQLRFEFYFKSNAVEVGTAANIQMTAFRLRAMFHEVDKSRKADFMGSPVNTLLFTDIKRHQENITLTAGSETSLELSGITGECHFLLIDIQSQGAVGVQERYYHPWDQIGLNDSGSKTLLGPVNIDWEMQKYFEWPRFFATGAQYIARNNRAIIAHGEDPNHTLLTAASTGSHVYTGKERLVIKAPAASVTRTVITLSNLRSDTAVASTPTGGTFYFIWTDPFSGVTSRSDLGNYNDSAAALNTLIRTCSSWDRRANVTFNQALSAGTSVTMTFNGDSPYGNTADITARNIQVVSYMTNGTQGIVVRPAVTTAGVRGLETGNVRVTVWGWNSSHIDIVDMGADHIEYNLHQH